MNNMSAEKNVPAIRIEGFSDEWEYRNLGSIYNKIRNAFVGTATPYYVESGNFYLESNNVKNGVINRNTEIFISDEFYKKQSDKWLKTGDIVMVQSGHVGHTAVIPPELNNIAAHALIMFTNPKEVINPYFFNFQFQTAKSKKRLSEITTGNTIKHILSSEMKEFYVYAPHSDEQTKIGHYFQQLDTLIAQHQKKHDKLLNLKKALLEKMFPKQGATEPAIRFAGFSGEWEEKAIKVMFKVTRGDVLAATETSNSKTTEKPYPVYSSQTKNDGLMGYYKDFLFENAITWTTDGANAGTVNFRKGKFYSTNVNGVLLSDKGYANKTIAEILNLTAWKHVSHVGNPKLMNNVMSEIKITTPSDIEEQNTIAKLLDCLDASVIQHQAQLKKLRNIKQACLDKMFV